MFSFNKIYTYEHLTPALWFRGLCTVSLSLAHCSWKPFQSVLNSVHGNGNPNLVNKTLKGHRLLQYSNHKPERGAWTEDLLELSSALCHIYFVFGCFLQRTQFFIYMYMLQCNHVAMWLNNHSCSWVLMRWCNI